MKNSNNPFAFYDSNVSDGRQATKEIKAAISSFCVVMDEIRLKYRHRGIGFTDTASCEAIAEYVSDQVYDTIHQ